MPADLTIFAAKYLVFIEALVAVPILAYLFYRRPREPFVRWTVGVVLMLIVAYVLAKVGAAIYNDPRPFAVDHVKPLIAHAADNGFPSDHALLAAAIVAAVGVARAIWSAVLIPFAVLVEWARVGAGLHHPIDVVGSDVCVAIGAVLALLVAPPLTRLLLPYLPLPRWLDMGSRDHNRVA